MALAGAVSGVEVAVFFALDATQFVCAHHASPGRATELVEQLLELGVSLHCCSACIHVHCQSAEGQRQLREGVRPSGMAALVKRASENYETLSF